MREKPPVILLARNTGQISEPARKKYSTYVRRPFCVICFVSTERCTMELETSNTQVSVNE